MTPLGNPIAFHAMGFFVETQREESMEQENNVLDELLREIASLLNKYPKAIEGQAAALHASGKDPELAEKLVKAADTMRDSGNLYLTWARHFAALAEGNTDASSDEDDTEDFGL
jgi:hypothetical protein